MQTRTDAAPGGGFQNGIADIARRLADIRKRLDAVRETCALETGFTEGTAPKPWGVRVLLALRNKFGFTKKDAEKLFQDYRGGKQKDQPDPSGEKPNEPRSAEEKISLIMKTMSETSAKLDRIESDIAELKRNVDEILKRL